MEHIMVDMHTTRTYKPLNEDVITTNQILTFTQIPDCIFCFEKPECENVIYPLILVQSSIYDSSKVI